MAKFVCIETPSNGFYESVEEAVKVGKHGMSVVQVLGIVQTTPTIVYEQPVKKTRKKRTIKEKSYGLADVLTSRASVPMNARCFLDGRPAVKRVADDTEGEARYVCVDHSDVSPKAETP